MGKPAYRSEVLIRDLIQDNVSGAERTAAIKWVDEMVTVYRAVRELGLLTKADIKALSKPRRPEQRAK